MAGDRIIGILHGLTVLRGSCRCFLQAAAHVKDQPKHPGWPVMPTKVCKLEDKDDLDVHTRFVYVSSLVKGVSYLTMSDRVAYVSTVSLAAHLHHEAVVFSMSIRGWRRTNVFRQKYSVVLLNFLKSASSQEALHRLDRTIHEVQQDVHASLAGRWTTVTSAFDQSDPPPPIVDPPLFSEINNHPTSFSASTVEGSDVMLGSPVIDKEDPLTVLLRMISDDRCVPKVALPHWKELLPGLWLDFSSQVYSKSANDTLRITHVVLVGTSSLGVVESPDEYNWAVVSGRARKAITRFNEIVSFIQSGLMCGGSVAVTMDLANPHLSEISAAILIAYFMHTLNLSKSKARGVTITFLGEALASRINWTSATALVPIKPSSNVSTAVLPPVEETRS